jgi:hypothetical protein
MFESIYVYYPRGVRTGGPEALHQLVDALRRVGQEAFLVPIESTRDRDRVSEYARYDAPECLHPADQAGNALVAPETHMEPLMKRGAATRFCWWLSVDNARVMRGSQAMSRRSRLDITGQRKTLRQKAIPVADRVRFFPERVQFRRRMTAIEHLTQSQYAWSMLYVGLGELPTMLSDYTPITPDGRDRVGSNGFTISYNPQKGGAYIDHLRALVDLPVEWLPIQGMTYDEVLLSLSRSDIYVDLGQHPGKDRLPREAALHGAVTVVARIGAGAFDADVPIPAMHKVRPGPSMVIDAAAVLHTILGDLPAHRLAQDAYRKTISGEKTCFNAEVRAIFVEGERGFDHLRGKAHPDSP